MFYVCTYSFIPRVDHKTCNRNITVRTYMTSAGTLRHDALFLKYYRVHSYLNVNTQIIRLRTVHVIRYISSRVFLKHGCLHAEIANEKHLAT